MYCKYCGKEIANDSVFCQFCGKNLIESISDNKEIESHDDLNLSSENETHNVGTEDKTQEVIIKTKEDSPLHVEISKKKENHSSTIANEIVGNLKMIGLAVVMVLVYMVLFSLIRIDCLVGLKNRDNFGKGFYDDEIKNRNLTDGTKAYMYSNWNYFYREYLEDKYKVIHDSIEVVDKFKKCKPIARKYRCNIKEMYYNINDFGNERETYKKISRALLGMEAWIIRENIKLTKTENSIVETSPNFYEDGQLSVQAIEERLNLSEEEINKLKEKAKKCVDHRWLASYLNSINEIRKAYFMNDLEEHVKYALIISFILTIVGRYFIKLFRWVNTNKTK